MTSLILCADDYAKSAAIDAGILALIEQGRLTAASCLTLSQRWPLAAAGITNDIREKADIGLHLDFTEFASPERHALAGLIARTFARSLSVESICTTINAQLNHFEDALGTPPDYIDGHQHVHQLPQIRHELVAILAHRYTGKFPWIRIAKPPPASGFKSTLIALLGAKSLTRAVDKAGLAYSGNLLGIYGFNLDAQQYRAKLSGWLTMAHKLQPKACALMCHPALAVDANQSVEQDPIYRSRLIEYQVLSSPDFATLLNQHGIKLVRGSQQLFARGG